MPGDVGLDRLVRPANLGRRVRLHVPGVELRRPADQHQHDAVHVLFAVDGALRFQAEQRIQGEAEGRKGAGMKKVAPAESVTKFNSTVGIKA